MIGNGKVFWEGKTKNWGFYSDVDPNPYGSALILVSWSKSRRAKKTDSNENVKKKDVTLVATGILIFHFSSKVEHTFT